MSKRPKRRPKLWKLLTSEDKKGVVRILLKAGYTREAIGKALGTTKNAIVGFQHQHLPKLTGKPYGSIEAVPEEILQPLVSSVWPTEEPDEETVEQADARMLSVLQADAEVTETKRPKLAASEATQCIFEDPDDRRCAFEWTDPITKRCTVHRKLR